MNYIIRKIRKTEVALLEDFLYEAIYIPDGENPPPREILKTPELKVYIDKFGSKKDDIAFVAETGKKIIGAVWVRIMNDFGSIDSCTPSLSISVYKPYRNKGIGTQMMKKMLKQLQEKGYKQTSLSVQKDNYASAMYLALGYEIFKENETDYIMVYRFR